MSLIQDRSARFAACALSLQRSMSAAMLVVSGIALVACGTTPKEDPNSTKAVEQLYADAKDDLAGGNLDRAIKSLERVEGRAAGTLLAQQATLDLAYAQYRSAERAAAQATLDRFIRLHPSSPALDYALYLRGLVNFNDNLGLLGALSRQQLSERDQQASRDAYQSFKQLVQQFPQSRYAADAQLRMDYIVNSLAEYELHVARYYFRRGAYLAAVNRAQHVVTDYPQSPSNEEALYIMMASYHQLGLEPLRADTERVLTKNFPDSRYATEGLSKAQTTWWQLW
jgi:outer membrane protein assembly factor BamD